MPRLDPADPRLAAPDFPHGSDRGYARGCSCERCRRAHAAVQAQRAHGRPRRERVSRSVSTAEVRSHIQRLMQEPEASHDAIARAARVSHETVANILRNSTAYISTVDAILAVKVEDLAASRRRVNAAAAQAHIEHLLTGEDASIHAIAAAAGLSPDAVRRIANGERTTIWAHTDRLVRGVTPYAVRRNAARVSSRRTVTMLRALQANGWPLKHLATLYGAPLLPFVQRDVVTQETERAVTRLFERIGDKPGPSAKSAAIARAAGYWPPIHYDDDMRLIPESIPDGRWEPKIERADRDRVKLRIMGLTLREYTAQQVSVRVGCSVKKVERIRREVGLQIEANAHESLLLDYIKPGQDELVALIREHVDGLLLNEELPIVDRPGLDYTALWESLVVGAERLRVQRDRAAPPDAFNDVA